MTHSIESVISHTGLLWTQRQPLVGNSRVQIKNKTHSDSRYAKIDKENKYDYCFACNVKLNETE